MRAPRLRGRMLASLVGLLAVTAVACGVGLTMVLLGAHYPTDAVGGYCLGITSTILTAAVLDSLAGLAGRLLRQTYAEKRRW